ncbi:TetR-like C-terminal domain-containing protein [Streptomyces sp. NBC_00887]|uniref:TetR-like C-terminal domain-containing protein n=1 Tax=Streptomyces sp. NBC_00887 TaxID=2975859 RepID=UPI003864BCC8|nr:TetR/AcrR family transcriptional regulator C-terminal ligand-binding domain-containing protein [Streptomyces sp. NBC_00887]WSY34847.1 TetR/AcrR family transcriptional regulator C-terminal ligand-binding domain-containing protein [Streptomyces sp. NBC_00887]
MPEPTPARPSLPGPRVSEPVFDATLRLLAEGGHERLTIESVALESGVDSKAIRRAWPLGPPGLVRAALIEAETRGSGSPDTGSLRGDLEFLVDQVLTLLTSELTRSAVRALAAGSDTFEDELGLLARDFFADRFTREHPVFLRAVERGELPAEAEPLLLVKLVADSEWVRAALREAPPLPRGFAESVVRVVHPVCRMVPPPRASAQEREPSTGVSPAGR